MHEPWSRLRAGVVGVELSDISWTVGSPHTGWVTLSQEDWHRINNVLAITYFCLLATYLTATENRDIATALRYIAFSAISMAQVKDDFWMKRSQV